MESKEDLVDRALAAYREASDRWQAMDAAQDESGQQWQPSAVAALRHAQACFDAFCLARESLAAEYKAQVLVWDGLSRGEEPSLLVQLLPTL